MAGAMWSSERGRRQASFKESGANHARVGPRCRTGCKTSTTPRLISTTCRSGITANARKREPDLIDEYDNKENASSNLACAGNSTSSASSRNRSSSSSSGNRNLCRPLKLQRRLSSRAPAAHSSSTTQLAQCKRTDDSGGDCGATRVHRELRGLILETPLKSRRMSAYFPDWSLNQKLDLLLKMGIVATTKVNESEEVHTLSICSQFAEENHLAMLQDSDRVSYYRKVGITYFNKPLANLTR